MKRTGQGQCWFVTAVIATWLAWAPRALAEEPASVVPAAGAPALPRAAQTGLSTALLRRLTPDTRDAAAYFFAASGLRNLEMAAAKVKGPDAIPVEEAGIELALEEVLRELVFGGEKVPPSSPSEREASDSFDDVVAVGSEWRWTCSGVQVGASFVLTAAHCLPATRVGIGHDLARLRQTLEVRAVHRAPDDLDVALLELSLPLMTVSRPWRLAGQTEAPFGSITVVGFGADDEQGRLGAGVMRRASFPIHGWGCDGFRAQVLGCRPSQELVIKSPARNDTCNGDSGGPVFEEVAGQFRLLAITSRPIPTRGSRCGNGGIYVRLDAIARWMLAIISGGRAGPRQTAPDL